MRRVTVYSALLRLGSRLAESWSVGSPRDLATKEIGKELESAC